MKHYIQTTLIALLALLPLGMQAQSVDFSEYEGTQIPNSDFETWGTEYKNVPVGWHSFESVTGTGIFVGFANSTAHTSMEKSDLHSGTTGYSCIKVVPRNLTIALANGTITTGRMYAGDFTPSSSKNHAQMDISETATSNGSPFYAELTARPAALAVWVKFTQGTPNADHPYATVSAAITNGNYYQEPTANNDSSVVIGYAKNNKIASNGGEWQHLYVPFRYDSDNYNKSDEPKAIMVTLSTNADAGQGSEGDELLIDDLELIYTHEVEIPASGYATFTNTVMKNHKVVMPEGLKGYALAVNAGGEPYITNTFEAGDVLPYNATLLLEGKAANYTFSTTLYDDAKAVPATVDEGLVPASELNNPLDGYKYFYLTGEGTTLAFRKADTGLKIQDDKALLRVLTDKAADSYSYVLKTPTKEGDVNDDSDVTIADIAELVNRLLGQKPVKFIVPSADVNGDDATTIADVTKLVNVLLNK